LITGAKEESWFSSCVFLADSSSQTTYFFPYDEEGIFLINPLIIAIL
jgi:hypothetical protein